MRHPQAYLAHREILVNRRACGRYIYTPRHLMYLLLVLFSVIPLSACQTTPNTCNQARIKLNWAKVESLQASVSQLSSAEFEGRKTQTAGAEKTRHYIKQQFSALGLTPWEDDFIVPFRYDTLFTQESGANVIAVAMAKVPTRQWRIVVAHYDHLGMKGNKLYAGADDNASGVAAMLAIAEHWQRNVAEHHISPTDPRLRAPLPNVNLMFVATDAEEPGLYGSTALVAQLKTRLALTDVELMINLDMIGHPARNYAVYLEGSRRFNHYPQFAPQLTQYNQLCIKPSYPKPIGRSIEHTDWLRASDHYPFHLANIPWLYFGVPTDTHYHTPQDTLDKIDFIFLAAVTESAFELIQLKGDFLRN